MSIVEYEQVEEVTETEKRARTLEAAALEIEMRGHAKGSLAATTGGVCAAARCSSRSATRTSRTA
jgi:hypothetical protein